MGNIFHGFIFSFPDPQVQRLRQNGRPPLPFQFILAEKVIPQPDFFLCTRITPLALRASGAARPGWSGSGTPISIWFIFLIFNRHLLHNKPGVFGFIGVSVCIFSI
jgi:hypothetical protein